MALAEKCDASLLILAESLLQLKVNHTHCICLIIEKLSYLTCQDYEHALVIFYRGQRIQTRRSQEAFKIGIRICKEAIIKCIGGTNLENCIHLAHGTALQPKNVSV